MADWIPPFAQTELGDLLAGTMRAVVAAQEELDAYTLKRRAEYEQAPAGTLALPPLCYAFRNVAVELELSATVAEGADKGPRLLCRTLSPQSVGLYGYQASAGVRVRVLVGPQGALPIKDKEPQK